MKLPTDQAEIQQLKKELWSGRERGRLLAQAPARRIVAEGDSWFDYKVGFDILDLLVHVHGYAIARVVDGGDTLENMTYGTAIDRKFRRKRPQIEATLAKVSFYKPRVVLLSAGGNDLAGGMIDRNLDSLLNHKKSGQPDLRVDHLRYVIGTYLRDAFQYFIDGTIGVNPGREVTLIAHGYGYVVPNGDRVLWDPAVRRLRVVGPWLRPAFARKGYDLQESQLIMNRIIDAFNDMLAGLQAANPGRFVYLDLRGTIDGRWANELHPKVRAFVDIAQVFAKAIQLLPP